MSKSSNPVTPGMNAEQLRLFLSKPYLMDLATISPTGYPHVTPVWFEYDADGEVFLVSTTRERKKARNISNNSKVGFSIAGPTLPYAAVVGSGNVIEIRDDPKGELLRRLAQKYFPAERADKYFQELMVMGGTRVILCIKPNWMLSWTGE